MRTIGWTLLGILILLKTVALAADPLTGRDYTGVCASCRGMNGLSTNPIVPSLAGQDRSYLIGQLQAFRDKRRRYAAMKMIVMELTEGDIAYMASYYAKPASDGRKRALPL